MMARDVVQSGDLSPATRRPYRNSRPWRPYAEKQVPLRDKEPFRAVR